MPGGALGTVQTLPCEGDSRIPITSSYKRKFWNHVQHIRRNLQKISVYRHYDSTGKETLKELEENWGSNRRAGVGRIAVQLQRPHL